MSITRKTRKLLETKLYCRNLITGINSWAVLLVRNSGSFLKWIREELKQMDTRTRKSWWYIRPYNPEMTYTNSMSEGRTEEKDHQHSRIVVASILQLEDYMKKMLRKIDSDNTGINRTKITRKWRTTVWKFELINKRNSTQENLNNSIEQCHKHYVKQTTS